MIAAKDRFIQLKFLHRAYYTPQRMASIYPQLDPTRPRCRNDVGTFWHMIWYCPKLRTYWEGVAEMLSDLSWTWIPEEPMVLLLSYLGGLRGTDTPNCALPSLCFMLEGR